MAILMATPVEKLVLKITVVLFIFFLIFNNISTSSFKTQQLGHLRITPSAGASGESQEVEDVADSEKDHGEDPAEPQRSDLNFFQFKKQPEESHVEVEFKYSIKPIVYIFPQYHPIPENDRLWGLNFTEWDNVRKVTHNKYGLETIRPHESIGYYNGLELSTRKRQGQFIKDSGIYGAVYHHYWFAGKPVMDGVIRGILNDGEPNTPFMLNWANEPWTARWDGSDSSEVYIAQEYGRSEDWRAHFEWLLPFFKHPLYIRSEGRVQFVVYKPEHMGRTGPHMFAAWRQWAIEEGLGGLDIIETRWHAGPWNQAMPDAVSEFAPHVVGMQHQRYPFTNRLSRVYHRGTLVCWDSTPRHVHDDGGQPNPTCHYKTWQYHLVQMFRRIKSDPNPIGAENFLFVNALNEWGEGNAMEPSVQFGDGYGKAIKAALEISDQLHPWPDVLRTKNMERLKQQQDANKEERPDICVLVQTSSAQASDKIYTLENMLRSLQEQQNQKWKALVYEKDENSFGELENTVFDTLDLRIKTIKLPEDIRKSYKEDDDAGYTAVDWIIANLNETDSACASAKYLLTTDGGNTYAPNAFDIVSSEKNADLVSLNFESKKAAVGPLGDELLWNSRCTRLDDSSHNFCKRPSPNLDGLDITATFINLERLNKEVEHKFSNFTKSHPQNQGAALVQSLINEHSWKWLEAPSTEICNVIHNPAFSSCQNSGNIWVDSPVNKEIGCYTVPDLFGYFGGDLDKIDLLHYRKNGYCMRYKQDKYEEAIKHKSQDTSPP